MSCFTCRKKLDFKCSIKDDFLELAEAIKNADTLILASPIYWFGIIGILKAAIDRFYCLLRFDQNGGKIKTPLEGKGLAIVITSGLDAFSGADLIESFIRMADFCHMNYLGTIGAYGINSSENIKNNNILLNDVKNFAKKISTYMLFSKITLCYNSYIFKWQRKPISRIL